MPGDVQSLHNMSLPKATQSHGQRASAATVKAKAQKHQPEVDFLTERMEALEVDSADPSGSNNSGYQSKGVKERKGGSGKKSENLFSEAPGGLQAAGSRYDDHPAYGSQALANEDSYHRNQAYGHYNPHCYYKSQTCQDNQTYQANNQSKQCQTHQQDYHQDNCHQPYASEQQATNQQQSRYPADHSDQRISQSNGDQSYDLQDADNTYRKQHWDYHQDSHPHGTANGNVRHHQNLPSIQPHREYIKDGGPESNWEPVFMFGKYKGKSLDIVATTDVSYLTWILKQDFPRSVHSVVEQYVQPAYSPNTHANEPYCFSG